MSGVPHWNPTPKNLSKSETGDSPVSEKTASPGPKAPASSAIDEPGRLAVPSPLSSAYESPIEYVPDGDISDASKDSFDWIGDDRKSDESEYEEAFFDEIAPAPPTRPPGASAFSISSIIPDSLWSNFLLAIFAGCMLIFAAKLVAIPLPHLAGVGLQWWVLIFFECIFVPIWAHTAILKTARFLRSIPVISKTELSAWLEAVKLPLNLAICSAIIGITWVHFFPADCGEPKPSGICIYEYMQRFFLLLFISGAIISLDIILMTTIRSSFQEKSFKNRLISNRFKVHVVDQLLLAAKEEKLIRRGQRPARMPTTGQESEDSADAQTISHHFIVNMPFLLFEQLWKLYRKLRSRRGRGEAAGPYIQVIRTDESGDINESTADFDEFKKGILVTIQTSGYETVASAPPRTDHEAKIMARMIFHYLCPAGRNYLLLDDFTKIIPSSAAARDAYLVFDLDMDGNITKTEFKNACVRIFREQRNLAQSFANTGSALAILDTLSFGVVGIGLFLLTLTSLGVRVQSILGITASIVLGLNFIVFDAANKTFHAVLFLFVMHPYDIGDRIVMGKDVGSSDEEFLSVVHINIQNTVFRRWNGLYVSIPNHVLAAAPLTNLSRAREQWERIEFALYAPDQHKLTVDEEAAKLSNLRRHIENFLKKHPRDYYRSFELRAVIAADGAKSDRNLDAIKFALKVRCKETVDSHKKWVRHARILAFVKQAVRQAGVEFASVS